MKNKNKVLGLLISGGIFVLFGILNATFSIVPDFFMQIMQALAVVLGSLGIVLILPNSKDR